VKFNNTASVFGTKGSMTMAAPFWCSQKIDTPEGSFDYPYPEAKFPFNFTNSAGLQYEAQHVRECLQKGLTESSVISLDETLLLAELMEEVRKQVGVEYPQDQ
jgi:dihydrodiol dehydrogenase / D-xylose 1-dehydrogenase (NADP)